jgi:AcrR family transcriptional regulator
MRGPNEGREMTLREIAEALGLSPTAVQIAEARGLAKCREVLGAAQPEIAGARLREEVARALRQFRKGI